ncbi:hypothetical protein SH668x_002028 [Planctomicrobium sp. SH668]|uniref:hypothetical protein n=1 Tax=Planctomicrobium sp. SH668 TaxID=3448126 RepID=UPI003F5B0BE2
MFSLTSAQHAATLLVLAIFAVGCGNSSTPEPTAAPPAATPPLQQSGKVEGAAMAPPARMEIPKISLSSSSPSTSTVADSGATIKNAEERRQELLNAMMPVQVLLGQWNGTTQRDMGQFKATDTPNWVWDFQTDRDQPALVMKSETSPYIREGRLTYLTEKELFQFKVVDADGIARTLEGTFSVPVEEFQGDDQQTHVKYKLELTQVDTADQRDVWQVIFNQQENNRYLQEMAKKRGASYLRYDTVATQRTGIAFAKSDEGYGDKECVVSGGLGTIELRHNGRSYWVCCTGCKAAFEEDPESWIANYQKKKAAKGS